MDRDPVPQFPPRRPLVDEQPADIDGPELEVLRNGVRLMALRAFGDADVAEEIAQEAIVRAFHALRESRPERLGAFIAGIARHIIADVIRSRARASSLHEVTPDAQPIVTPDPIADLCHAEEKARVLEALRQIPDGDRELLHLIYYQDQSPTEVARELGLTPESIRQRKLRALARLRRAFDAASSDSMDSHARGFDATLYGDLNKVRRKLGTT